MSSELPLFERPSPPPREDLGERIPGARPAPRFNGSNYEPAKDDFRLTGQILRVFELMRDGTWRTLQEIADETGDPHASISAQLRHLRKVRFGAHLVEKRSRGDRVLGLFEYRLTVSR
jgi:hypothetical protein